MPKYDNYLEYLAPANVIQYWPYDEDDRLPRIFASGSEFDRAI